VKRFTLVLAPGTSPDAYLGDRNPDRPARPRRATPCVSIG
jgi:hypothetical protein